MERYIAVDNICAWPNLVAVPDGRVVAIVFNQPCHGRWEGDVECWESGDGGRFWRRCGVPAPHEPKTNRMNVGAGLARNGDLLVIASGWGGENFREYCLPCWVCRSADGGRTWTHSEGFPPPDGCRHIIPFGKIVKLPDGALAVAGYARPKGAGESSAFLLRSEDDGVTWGAHVKVAEGRAEPDLLSFDDGRVLCASRSSKGAGLLLSVSEDGGRTWRADQPLTGGGEFPAHMLALRDGRILLTYGIRQAGNYGIGSRFSEDGGRYWYRPAQVVRFGDALDGGYPSSVELDDGRILTAYYASSVPNHTRYHMGVAIWDVMERNNRNRDRPRPDGPALVSAPRSPSTGPARGDGF